MVRVTGGLGDALISIGSFSKYYEKHYQVFAFVRDHQVKLISELVGVSEANKVELLNRPSIREQFPVAKCFDGLFNLRQQLKDSDYYSLVESHVGHALPVGQFKSISHTPRTNRIALHPGASNPNRRWKTEQWLTLGRELQSIGCDLLWLGTKDEPGFSSSRSIKLSDIDECLVAQTKQLATCSYFIGCDSSFAHVAGILGIPGVVLFFATKPANVICRYPSLTSPTICSTFKFTGSLDPHCLTSKENQEKLTWRHVFPLVPKTEVVKNTLVIESPTKKDKVKIISEDSAYVSEFSDLYDLVRESQDFTILDLKSSVEIHTNDSVVRVRTRNIEDVRRTIRELKGRSNV
jgi:hypothetical protein